MYFMTVFGCVCVVAYFNVFLLLHCAGGPLCDVDSGIWLFVLPGSVGKFGLNGCGGIGYPDTDFVTV